MWEFLAAKDGFYSVDAVKNHIHQADAQSNLERREKAAREFIEAKRDPNFVERVFARISRTKALAAK